VFSQFYDFRCRDQYHLAQIGPGELVRLPCHSEKLFDQIDIIVHCSRSAYRRPRK
jgi:hypothetical protein